MTTLTFLFYYESRLRLCSQAKSTPGAHYAFMCVCVSVCVCVCVCFLCIDFLSKAVLSEWEL